MKIRKEAVILGVVIVVLSLYLVFNKRDRNLYDLPNLEPIAVSEISKISLDSSESTILLTQKAGEWVVNEAAYPGDKTTIKRVAEIIANLKLTTLISESKDYARYDLDPEHKITIKAWNGDSLVREFDMGKAATGHRHTFVKLDGDDRVYHAQENFRNSLQGNPDKFRDKGVMSFEPDQIQQIQLSGMGAQSAFIKETSPEATAKTPTQGETAALQEGKPVWKNEAGELVKDNKLIKLLGDFSTLKCSTFVAGAKKSDYKDPIAAITFKGTEEYTLQVFERLDEAQSQHPAVSSQSDYVFFIPKWQADQLTKSLADIVAVGEIDKKI